MLIIDESVFDLRRLPTSNRGKRSGPLIWPLATLKERALPNPDTANLKKLAASPQKDSPLASSGYRIQRLWRGPAFPESLRRQTILTQLGVHGP